MRYFNSSNKTSDVDHNLNKLMLPHVNDLRALLFGLPPVSEINIFNTELPKDDLSNTL